MDTRPTRSAGTSRRRAHPYLKRPFAMPNWITDEEALAWLWTQPNCQIATTVSELAPVLTQRSVALSKANTSRSAGQPPRTPVFSRPFGANR